jgi:bacteriocin-like protein
MRTLVNGGTSAEAKNPNLAEQKDDAELSDKELDKVTGGHAHPPKAPTTPTQTTTSSWDITTNKAV